MTAPKNPNSSLLRARLGDVVAHFQRQAISDAQVLDAARRASEILDADEGTMLWALPDEELEKKGWTRAALRVAIHGNKPKSEVPVYMLLSQERHVARMKTLPQVEGGDEGLAKAVVVPSGPVIDVDEVDEDDEDVP